MSTQVLSRTRLLGLINRFHLYPTYAYSPDDQVEKMRDDVKMDLIQGESNISGKAELLAFKISYKAPRAEAAQKVTIALTSFFVDENVRASQEQSASDHALPGWPGSCHRPAACRSRCEGSCLQGRA